MQNSIYLLSNDQNFAAVSQSPLGCPEEPGTEKKIFVANVEDPDTKEEVPHYSAKSWYATP
jgi:hypothetical protein